VWLNESFSASKSILIPNATLIGRFKREVFLNLDIDVCVKSHIITTGSLLSLLKYQSKKSHFFRVAFFTSVEKHIALLKLINSIANALNPPSYKRVWCYPIFNDLND
jgi:hypothetical protein